MNAETVACPIVCSEYMIDLLKFVSNNSLIAALISAIVIGISTWQYNIRRDYCDSKKIYNFLASSKETSEFKFRSTEAIAANTQISEVRVAKLCASHPKIRRNEKEKQSWRLDE